MVRFLLRALIFFGAAAVGLVVAALLVQGFTLSVSGSLTAVLVFAVAQSLLAPVVAKVTTTAAPALLGGIGVITTFIAVFIASLFRGGLVISGVLAWIAGPLVVWLVTALATWLLSKILLKTGNRAAAHSD
jgi:Mycobacterial 4 TMS phage holin, superfamily IV